MLGWLSWLKTSISRWKRLRNPVSWASSAASTLSAARLPLLSSWAMYTRPMPPRPSSLSRIHFPSRAPIIAVIFPLDLSAGVHVRRDLTEARRVLSEKFPQVSFALAEPLGPHPLLLEVVLERARKAQLDEQILPVLD